MDPFQRKHTYQRVSLTEKCNQRCIYCMPEDGITLSPSEKQLSEHEYKQLISFFIKEGVSKIRYTGGEPTLSPFLPTLISYAKEEGAKVGKEVKVHVTTNGLALGTRNGARQTELVNRGLDGVNISLDTLQPARFEVLSRRKGHEHVLRCIDTAMRANILTKLNCVVMRGKNDDELSDFVEFIRDKPVDVRFIEFMPFQQNQWELNKIVSLKEILSRQRIDYPSLEQPHGDTSFHDNITKQYKISGVQGRIGVISSVTDNFCFNCNRIRITANGMVKNCLWSNDEVDILTILRNNKEDPEIHTKQQALVKLSLSTKQKEHDPADQRKITSNRPMITIGG